MTVLGASREAAKVTLYAHEPQVASLSVLTWRGKPLPLCATRISHFVAPVSNLISDPVANRLAPGCNGLGSKQFASNKG
jgi:hypothetical protein